MAIFLLAPDQWASSQPTNALIGPTNTSKTSWSHVNLHSHIYIISSTSHWTQIKRHKMSNTFHCCDRPATIV